MIPCERCGELTDRLIRSPVLSKDPFGWHAACSFACAEQMALKDLGNMYLGSTARASAVAALSETEPASSSVRDQVAATTPPAPTSSDVTLHVCCEHVGRTHACCIHPAERD